MTIVERGPFVRVEEGDPRDKAVTVSGNGMEVLIVANEDGSLYIEAVAQDYRAEQVVVQEAFIDRYRTTYPHIRLALAKRQA